MSGAHVSARIDSTAFRRGVRALKTGASNPYNGPDLRDEWQAGLDYAKNRKAIEDWRSPLPYDAVTGRRKSQDSMNAEMARAMSCVDRTYDADYMAEPRSGIATPGADKGATS